jgi:hypothetical protein
MAARAMFEAGECFLRFRPRRPEDGLTVPLQLQMLSPEHLPLSSFEPYRQRLQSIRAKTCSRAAKNRCHPPLAPW